MRPIAFIPAVICLCVAAHAAELSVGPGRQFARIEDAVAAAKPGDTISVHPLDAGRPYEKVALYITTPRLTIRAAAPAGGRIAIDGTGFDYSGRGRIPRAIVQFNKGADGCVLEGFELIGARNDSGNGAGVRINQANDVTVRNCEIRGNDMGIMSNGDGTPASAANQLIENCLIHSNGEQKRAGYNHNLYLGGTSVRLIGCEIHSSLTGHNIKSRAHRTEVMYCYVHDSANRELDLVDARGDTTAEGSDAVLVGNIIVKDPACPGNRGVIHFGQDGGHEHDGTVWLAHNTIITRFITPVVTLSSPKARAQFYNNIICDNGARQSGQRLVECPKGVDAKQAVAGQSNWLSTGFAGRPLDALGLKDTRIGAAPPFAGPAKRDFRLKRLDPEFTATDLPATLTNLIGPKLHEPQRPLGHQARQDQPKPAIGAVGWSTNEAR